MQNAHVSILVLSSQCVFPFFASILLTLYFIYLIEIEPINLGKNLNSQAADDSPDEIKTAAISKVWIIVTISFLLTAGAIATDIGALVEYTKLPQDIKDYFNDHSNSASVYLYVVPITMLVFDLLSLLLFIFGPYIVVACCKCYKCIQKHRKDSCCDKCVSCVVIVVTCCICKCIQTECCSEYPRCDKCVSSRVEACSNHLKCCKYSCCWCECEFKYSNSLYTLLSPLSCIATHSYHIIFAFINNPFHATSVLLSYIMTLFIVVVILQKTYYFVH
jgi:hypothetical protein